MKPDYTALEFPPARADRPYVIINMVMSVDGKVVIEDTEQGIGSKVDQRLMRELRVHADVVLNGATTLRKSGTSSRLGDPILEQLRESRGRTKSPIAAVVSASGDLPLERIFFTARDFEAVIYLSDAAPRDRRAALVATGRPIYAVPAATSLAAMLRHMRAELGAKLLLVEGGPTVNAGLFALGAVDEIFMSLGPVIVGGKDQITPVEGTDHFLRENAPRLSLVHAFPNGDTDEVYLRYRLKR